MNNKIKEITIKIKTLKYGQIKKYGDSKYEYELEIKGMSEFEVKRYCTMILSQCNQTHEEWENGMRDSANIYFKGYYEFEQIEKISFNEGKYRYFVHSPSTC